MQQIFTLSLTFILFYCHLHAQNFIYGSKYVESALVHYILPEDENKEINLIMIPGLNLSSYIFATTPDGRQGWAEMFAGDGYDVYMINDPRFDFATGGFTVAPFTDVPELGQPEADPGSSLPWQSDIWRRWGFGESENNPYHDARFPTDSFEHFAANYPYVGTENRDFTNSLTALIDSITGPVILLAHSAGGPIAINAAKERIDRVKGFVFIEPTGPPDEDDFPEFSDMIMLGVYGDYIQSRRQTNRKLGLETAAELFNANGGVAEVISMPDDKGVYGNSHIYMQDNNNDSIQMLISQWLDSVCVSTNTIDISVLEDWDIQCYPNPTEGHFIVDIPSELSLDHLSIYICDLSGKQLAHIKPDSYLVSIELPRSLSNSLIQCVLYSDNRKVSSRLINICN